MPQFGRADLATLLERADPETVAGFVAAVYDARGYPVDYDGGRSFVVTTATGTERVGVPTDGTATTADRLVVAGDAARDPDDAANAIDADLLWEWLRYAVSNDAADALLEEWFGREFTTPGPPTAVGAGDRDAKEDGSDSDGGPSGPGGDDGRQQRDATGAPVSDHDSTGDGSRRDRGPDGGPRQRDDGGPAPGTDRPWSVQQFAGRLSWRRAVYLAIAVVALVALAGVGASVWALPSGGDANVSTTAGTATATTPFDSLALTTTVSRARPTPGSASATVLPPGMNETGIVDADRLANAHEAIVERRAHRVTLTYTEFENGDAVGSVVQTVKLANATTYRGTRVALGDLAGEPPLLVGGDVYADGSARFVRTDAGVRQEPLAGDNPHVDRVEQYHRWYLSVEDSWVENRTTVGNRTLTYVGVDGDPWPGVEATRGTVVVDDRGLVRSVRRSYRDPATGRRVVVSLRVSDLGRTTVTEPEWL